MNIYVPCLLSLSILLTYSLTLNLLNLCSCSQLVNEQNCNDYPGVCSWNKNSCEDVACSDILILNYCLSVPTRCYWSGGCKDFTSCEQIERSSTENCKQSNYYCPATNGTNCGPIEQLQTCQAQTNQSACNSLFSQQGLCIWYGGQCVVASSCSQFYDPATNSCQYSGCYLSGTTCLPKTCSNIDTSCEAGIPTFGPYLQNTVACQWNEAQNICEDFDQSSIDSVECYLYSLGTYAWSKEKSNKGSCQQCFGGLIKIIFIITISLVS